MVKEIVFHLGDRKTGSTSIQDALRRKIWAQEAGSILYPAKLHHSQLAGAVGAAYPSGKRRREFDRITGPIANASEEIAVISSEYFEAVDPKDLSTAIKEFLPSYYHGIRLIAYVRPHVERIVSSHSERVKLGVYAGNLDSYTTRTCKNKRFMYVPRFAKWRSVFGDRFELRPMIRSQLTQNCVVRDFLSFVLRQETVELKEEVAANESSSLTDLAVMHLLHQAAARSKYPHDKLSPIGRQLAIELAGMPHHTPVKPAMHRDGVKQVMETYGADAEALDKAFFTGDPMVSAMRASLDKALDQPQSVFAEDHFPPETLRLLQAWAGMTIKLAVTSGEGWHKRWASLRLADAGGPVEQVDEDEDEDVAPQPARRAARGRKRGSSAA